MLSNTTENQLHTKLSFKYIRGEGIVIGLLHLPFQIPKNIRINYVDNLDCSQSVLCYQEVPDNSIAKPNIIDNPLKLETIQDDKFDFCIANQVLHHIKNPIAAIINWLRVLKPGGILYITVPRIENQLYNVKNQANMNELIQEFQGTNVKKDNLIYDQITNEISLKDMLSYILSIKPDYFSIREFLENEVNGVYESLIILEKNTFYERIFQTLKSKSNNSNEINCNLDIIVPVYNAYDDLLRCLNSLIEYQNDYRIILINDKSTDKRITYLFSQLKYFETNKLILLENDINQGFVGTVNQGMKYSNNDVILLNSDTVVTKGWAKKLTKCAYSETKIGTVTPFTNNGTICSVPNFCENNEIPQGFTIDSYAEFIENISLKKYTEIPTAVGFCMFIKREVLNKIGYFDEETFGKGYGEENDFCMRIMNIGYKNILCDDTFVFHKGEASFSDSKKELANKNLQLLANRYPQYLPMVANFCQSNPLDDSHKAIKLREKTWDFNNKKRILYILHNLGGGTEKHVFDLINNLKEYVFYIVQIVEGQLVVTEYNNDSNVKYRFWLSERINLFTFYNENYKKILERVINTFKIDIIHVQHLIGYPLDVFNVAQKYNIPLLFTMHDFYTVCPRINLLDKHFEYCHNSNSLEKCSQCLMETMNLPSDYINHWRNNFEDAFKKCDVIIAPSDSVIKILNKYYPDIEKKHYIIGHGHSEELFVGNNIREFNINKKVFNIAYIGILNLHKGRKVFCELANSEELKAKVKWSVFGTSDVYIGKGYSPAQNIYYYGKYDGFDHLRKLISDKEIDLVILPAVCPETFSYALSEAWALKIPVLVSNLGALSERVETNGGGWITDFKNLNEVKKLIKHIMETPSEYMEKKKEVEHIHLKKHQEMATEYENIYEKIIKKPRIKCEHKDTFSNYELLSSIHQFDRERNNLKELIVRNHTLRGKLFLCFRQNGFWYTMKRLRIYLSGNF